MAKPKKKRTKKYAPNRRPNSILASLPVDKETQARLRGSIDEAMERLAASTATNGDLATILSVLEIAEPLVDGLEDPEAARTRLARGDELISALIEGTVTQSVAAEGLKDAVVLAFEAVARAHRVHRVDPVARHNASVLAGGAVGASRSQLDDDGPHAPLQIEIRDTVRVGAAAENQPLLLPRQKEVAAGGQSI